MKNKCADAKMIGEETIKLILGVAVVLILVLLIYNLVSPMFDKDKKTAESYLKNFEKEIEVADGRGVGKFSIWQPEKEDGTHFYLVYFSDKVRVEKDEEVFFSVGDNKNLVCICYVADRESFCNACIDLEFPIDDPTDSEGGDVFAVGQGKKLEINKQDNFYFVEVDE